MSHTEETIRLQSPDAQVSPGQEKDIDDLLDEEGFSGTVQIMGQAPSPAKTPVSQTLC